MHCSRAAIAALVVVAACSEDALDAVPVDDDGPKVRFRLADDGVPDPLEIPFPSDLYLTDGRLPESFGSWRNLGTERADAVISGGLAGLDGFGRGVGAIFLVDGAAPVDASMLAPESYGIVDLDTGTSIPAAVGHDELLRTIVVQPSRTVLEPGHRYAIYLGTGIATTDGEELRAAPDLADMIELAPHDRATPVETLYGEAIDTLQERGIELAGLAVFTTQRGHELLYRARDALVSGRYGPPPELLTPEIRFGADPHPGWTATLQEWLGDPPLDAEGKHVPGFAALEPAPDVGIAHDGIGAVLTGAMVSPELRRPFMHTASASDGTWMLDADGTPIAIDPSAEIPVTLVLPRTPPPRTGWPVVMFGHGTPTHRSYVMSVANELARAGIAVATIDAPEHGLRTPGASDSHSEFEGSYDGPDGMADGFAPLLSTLAALGFLQNFARARDVRAQTIVDYCQLRRLLANPQLDLGAAAEQYGGVTPSIDPSRLGWAGVSFGGINGMILAAVEPEIRAFFLDVGGGLEWVTIGESPANLPQVDIALSEFGFPSSSSMRLGRFNPVLTVLQMMFDSVDAASFAADATRRHDPGPDLYVVQVDHDEAVPNYGTEVVAALMGIPQVTASAVRVEGLEEIAAPVRANAGPRTRALLVQTLAVHGRNFTSQTGTRTAETPFPREDAGIDARIVYLDEPIAVRQPVAATQRAAVRFFQTAWDGMAEIAVDGMEFRIDFDDDGWDDADERARATDPFDPTDHP